MTKITLDVGSIYTISTVIYTVFLKYTSPLTNNNVNICLRI